jgi:predicted Zn-dependent protease
MYGSNPRNGFFESNRFMHPELAFRLDLPEGWQKQNLAQYVVAGSPANDAVIQLTSEAGAHTEAADAFFASEGVTRGNVDSKKINGLPAVLGSFQAQTEQGQIGGIAAFISLANRTYRILAYTPAAKLSGYQGTFLGTIRSFDRLTDRAALARQPNRLAIVRLPRAMNLAQFNRSYPSTISLEELGLINRVSSPDSVLPEGFPAKRVIER